MADQSPDWLNWVRRVPPQEDAERVAAPSVNETEQEGQNPLEWRRLSEMSDSIPEGAKTPKKSLKFAEVCIAPFPWTHNSPP